MFGHSSTRDNNGAFPPRSPRQPNILLSNSVGVRDTLRTGRDVEQQTKPDSRQEGGAVVFIVDSKVLLRNLHKLVSQQRPIVSRGQSPIPNKLSNRQRLPNLDPDLIIVQPQWIQGHGRDSMDRRRNRTPDASNWDPIVVSLAVRSSGSI
ncbi:hypothetical protein BDN71DRAFT_1442162 [Pleurotus eryngii]|uniref:Uncharacterized protein n=1 Tax=Pleurotus eryngii TaxID=5323 RepID=A0A9P6DJK6_PLEER|nr:hypothetical protein BDN71DRAFT_1442162 [Pleurotus eryngii]